MIHLQFKCGVSWYEVALYVQQTLVGCKYSVYPIQGR
jgi:hypothetical protein